jgi:hypothetical protein
MIKKIRGLQTYEFIAGCKQFFPPNCLTYPGFRAGYAKSGKVFSRLNSVPIRA